jgi:hypothetical protein
MKYLPTILTTLMTSSAAAGQISSKFGLKPRDQAEKYEEIARLNFWLFGTLHLP